MKKLNSAVALAALAAVMSTPAFAADVAAVEPAPAAADWTAFHVGIGGGGNFAFADDSVNAYHHHINNGEFLDGESFSDLGKAGAFGTVEGGFDYQMNSIVVGVLANYDFGKTEMDHKNNVLVTDNNGNFLDDGTLKDSWDIGDSWAVGGRLGWLATDSTLIYLLGGYTQAKIEESVDLFSSNHSSNFSSDDWEDGYFVGGGIETMLTNSISLKGEYRFSDFGNVHRKTNDFGNHNNNNFHDGSDHEADITIHSVRAVLSFRF